MELKFVRERVRYGRLELLIELYGIEIVLPVDACRDVHHLLIELYGIEI